MEIEQYICPKCQVKLKKSIWEQKKSNVINDNIVCLYEGICKSCKSRFTFFYDPIYDKAVFWTKEDENIFKENFEKKHFFTSIKILYLMNEKKINSTLESYKKTPTLSQNLIVASYGFSDLINKLDLRKNHKILFIEQDMLDTKFEKNYPCILAEKNICELVKNWKNYQLYSDHKTYYNNFVYLGEQINGY